MQSVARIGLAHELRFLAMMVSSCSKYKSSSYSWQFRRRSGLALRRKINFLIPVMARAMDKRFGGEGHQGAAYANLQRGLQHAHRIHNVGRHHIDHLPTHDIKAGAIAGGEQLRQNGRWLKSRITQNRLGRRQQGPLQNGTGRRFLFC